MNITGKYLEALKKMDGWVTVSEWAVKVGELYPDILEKAAKEAANQANDTTGPREIAARISSSISRGAYSRKIEIDDSERPRQIKYLPESDRDAYFKHDVDDDVAPLVRADIIKDASKKLGSDEKYRMAEFETVSKQLKAFFGLEFEVDHAQALLNEKTPGKHHPDNFQLLLKAHNAKKSNNNWERFSFDEQTEYIKTAIKLQSIVSSRLSIDMENNVLGSLLDRLEKIY